MKALVLLSGCGVYDGSEIHESVLTLLSLDERGIRYRCAAPDMDQYHVIDHTNGEEMPQKRNVLVEAARIARGAIHSLDNVDSSGYDMLLMPGGFGAAKNWSQWALKGPEGTVHAEVAALVRDFVEKRKVVGALCMSPVVVAQALQGVRKAKLTVGTTEAASPYDIKSISAGLDGTGAQACMTESVDICVDADARIVSTPCYMMEAGISEVKAGIDKLVDACMELARQEQVRL